MMDGSGQALALMAILTVLERDAVARGEPSIAERAATVLLSPDGGSILKGSQGRATPTAKQWRQDAIDFLRFVKESSAE